MSIKKLQRISWVLVVGASLSAGEPLTVSEASQKAWRDQSGLKAGQAMVDSRQAEAEGYRDLRLPTLTLNAFIRFNPPEATSFATNPKSLERL